MAWIVTRSRDQALTETLHNASITVWDNSADPTDQSGPVYRWNGYEEKDSV